MQDAPEFLKSLAIVFGVLIVEDLIGILLMSVLTAVSSENEDHHPGGQQRYAQAMRNSGADEAIIPEHGGGLDGGKNDREILRCLRIMNRIGLSISLPGFDYQVEPDRLLPPAQVQLGS